MSTRSISAWGMTFNVSVNHIDPYLNGSRLIIPIPVGLAYNYSQINVSSRFKLRYDFRERKIMLKLLPMLHRHFLCATFRCPSLCIWSEMRFISIFIDSKTPKNDNYSKLYLNKDKKMIFLCIFRNFNLFGMLFENHI